MDNRRLIALGLVLSGSPSLLMAQANNLRITEVDPDADQVEITNIGGAFTSTSALPFCHSFNYQSTIPNNTLFAQNQARLFDVTALADAATDLWLYSSGPFFEAGNIIHGVQFGSGGIGRAELASGVDLWSGDDTFAPTPMSGATLAWDGFGDTSFDWYVDETPSLGAADVTEPATVPSVLAFPGAEQDFESLALGDELIALEDWPIVNGSEPGRFTIRSVSDVQGITLPRGDSTRWLRIHDQDEGMVQNRFYGPYIEAPAAANYEWTFWVNVERTPPAEAAASKPRFTIQHRDSASNVVNTWGVEYEAAGAFLIVTDQGGEAARSLLHPLTSPTAVGDWIKISLLVDFDSATVSATANDGPPVSLAISPDLTVNPASFRFCYRGEGAGNIGTFLLDDVAVSVDDPDLVFSDGFES